MLGNISIRNEGEKLILSTRQYTKKTPSVSAKLTKAETFLENMKRYLGTLILVTIAVFCTRLVIPVLVASL